MKKVVNLTIGASLLLVEALPLGMNLTGVVNATAYIDQQQLDRSTIRDLDDVYEYSAGGGPLSVSLCRLG